MTLLHPGCYSETELCTKGHNHHTQLFPFVWKSAALTHGHGHGGGGHGHGGGGHGHGGHKSVNQTRVLAEGPSQAYLQAMLLASSLYLTVMVTYAPEGAALWWDPAVAIGVLPVLLMMLFSVPDLLPSMTIALSVEKLYHKQYVETVVLDTRMRKFVQATAAMQAMRSSVKAKKRRDSSAQRDAPKFTSSRQYMDSLEPRQRKRALQLKEAFEKFDAGLGDGDGRAGDGQLELDEIGLLMGSLGEELSASDLAQLVNELDTSRDGKISFVEFAQYMLDDTDEPDAEAVAHEIFSMLDTDKSDVLSAEEMTKALTRLLAGVTDDEVANLVRMFDADNSGQVERDDFVEFVAKALEESA